MQHVRSLHCSQYVFSKACKACLYAAQIYILSASGTGFHGGFLCFEGELRVIGVIMAVDLLLRYSNEAEKAKTFMIIPN